MSEPPNLPKPSGGGKRMPRQERSQQTYERLLQVAGELLAEVGIERISTNLICARAGMTPPALYRYFKDKYAVLEALGRRLMERQNAVLAAWLDTHGPQGARAMNEATLELMRATAEATAAEPGALWTLRALRAVPQLAHVRIESHRQVTDQLFAVYARHLPAVDPEILWMRVRISVEFGFAADEMIAEDTGLPREALLRQSALMMQSLRFDDPEPRAARARKAPGTGRRRKTQA